MVGLQGITVGSNEERTRTQVTNNLKKKLARTMDEFTTLRNSIMTQYRDVVERRFYTVMGSKPTEEQVDDLIETGEAENMFQKAIQNQGRGKVRFHDVLLGQELLVCTDELCQWL